MGTWELSTLPPRSIRGQKWASNWFFITGKGGRVSVKFRKHGLIKASEGRSAVETVDSQRDQPVQIHSDNGFERNDDSDGGLAKQIWYIHKYSARPAGGVPDPQQICSLCKEAKLDVRLLPSSLRSIWQRAWCLCWQLSSICCFYYRIICFQGWEWVVSDRNWDAEGLSVFWMK